MITESLPIFIPLVPFAGFVLNALLGKRLSAGAVSWLAGASVGTAFLIGVAGFLEVAGLQEQAALTVHAGRWISAGGFDVSFGLTLDRLSAVLVLVVSGVSTLVHVHSAGYMRDDPGQARYFAFLNLMTAAMLALVLADNLLVFFLGWEVVGLCSFLLIGFWYRDPDAGAASLKAFVVHRIGDLALLLAIFLTATTCDDLRFTTIAGAASTLDAGTVTGIALLLWVAAVGKSAQIPLHVWLPDSVAAPTPVSALIHSVTAVASGVYLVARLAPVFQAAPEVSALMAIVGAVTAILAAAVALAQTDINKVLAYSTISQLGYMFLAAGVGAYHVAIFHLVTHAFFKALLFLGAGAVIHALHHEQDMSRMGGLRRRVPETFWLFAIGAMALSAVPLSAGFFSTSEILHAIQARSAGAIGWELLRMIGLVTAFLTAAYAFRQVALVFLGEYRGRRREIHAAPPTMRAPLYVLAALSVAAGFLGVPDFFDVSANAMDLGDGRLGGWILVGMLSLAGVGAAYLGFVGSPGFTRALLARWKPARFVERLCRKKFYIDEIYRALFVKPLFALSEVLFLIVDRALIDVLLVGGAGWLARVGGGALRRLESGGIPTHTAWFLAGVLGVLAAALWFR